MKKNPKAIVEIVDSVEQTLEQAHRGLAVARDERFATEGAALAIASLRIALETLEEAASSRIVEKPEPEDAPEPPKDEKPAPERVRVRTSNPIRYVVDVIAHARKTHGLTVAEIAELCECSPETIYRYGTLGKVRGGEKRATTARRLVETIVALTGYNRA